MVFFLPVLVYASLPPNQDVWGSNLFFSSSVITASTTCPIALPGVSGLVSFASPAQISDSVFTS